MNRGIRGRIPVFVLVTPETKSSRIDASETSAHRTKQHFTRTQLFFFLKTCAYSSVTSICICLPTIQSITYLANPHLNHWPYALVTTISHLLRVKFCLIPHRLCLYYPSIQFCDSHKCMQTRKKRKSNAKKHHHPPTQTKYAPPPSFQLTI